MADLDLSTIDPRDEVFRAKEAAAFLGISRSKFDQQPIRRAYIDGMPVFLRSWLIAYVMEREFGREERRPRPALKRAS